MTATLVFLIQALFIIALPFVVARFLRLRGVVPIVVVQIVGGIALGPSLFGQISPDFHRLLFNATTLTPLSGIASIAVLFFGFITGLHLETSTFHGRGRAFGVVAVASVAVPTVAGFLAGLWIIARFPEELGPGINPAAFAAAIGIATGVTALPVLGAILHEMKLLGQRIGDLALGLAAVNDVGLWILLGVLLTAVAGHGTAGWDTVARLVGLPVYLIFMLRGMRPLLREWATWMLKDGKLKESGLAVACGVALGSAVVTEFMGLHYLLGAFVAGMVTPHELRGPILERIQLMTVGVLMPFFFILTGLRTRIDFGSPALLEIFIVATAVAMAGKIGGTAVTARLVGEPWPTALALGTLMQTKGLMEVIVLTILLEGGIISQTVFSAMIVMAVVTTGFAMPFTRLALSRSARTIREKEPARLATQPSTPDR